ncbi:glycosyltransferase [Caulobacter segnis]|uniref:glycosyltransferase n=1 Tax=Caulobacter segnis TaxID=88688 RepID=UPI002410165F|nr:glycosyltransferase [Caulobacter segnis]MDG2520495.1 glycosyltransferase [Caulobacter segnis]
MVRQNSLNSAPPHEIPVANSHLDVSVVCANYNNGPYLDEFFLSFVASTRAPRELIFVDDGSTDNSLAIAQKFAFRLPFLKIVALERNQGFGNALNVGIEQATCRFIMRIDPDDVMLPERIEVQHQILASGAYDIVGSNAEIFHSDTGRVLGKTNFPLTHDDIAAKIRAGEHGVLHPTVMARASFFKSQRYVQENVPAEDYDIFARMLAAGARFANIDSVLMRYRVHQKSASNILPFSTISKTYALRDRIFNDQTPKMRVWMYFVHIKFYRKYLFESNYPFKVVFLVISSIFYPAKFFSRVRRMIRTGRDRRGKNDG